MTGTVMTGTVMTGTVTTGIVTTGIVTTGIVPTGIVKERVHMVGVPERIGWLLIMVVSGFEPRPPVWQASALSIGLPL